MCQRKELHLEILDILKDRMENNPDKYVNPHFMQKITELIWEWYDVEDDAVDDWILDMFGA